MQEATFKVYSSSNDVHRSVRPPWATN